MHVNVDFTCARAKLSLFDDHFLHHFSTERTLGAVYPGLPHLSYLPFSGWAYHVWMAPIRPLAFRKQTETPKAADKYIAIICSLQ